MYQGMGSKYFHSLQLMYELMMLLHLYEACYLREYTRMLTSQKVSLIKMKVRLWLWLLMLKAYLHI